MRHRACIPCHSVQPGGERPAQAAADRETQREVWKRTKRFAVETTAGSGYRSESVSRIISSRCRSLQRPRQRRSPGGVPCPLVPQAGQTALSPRGCRWAAPRSGRPCLWAAALADLPCCARFRSQNTQRDLKNMTRGLFRRQTLVHGENELQYNYI